MANFTENAFFDTDINLPSTSSSTSEGENLALFITKWEPKILAELLGYEFAKNLIEEFNTDPQPTSGDLFDLWNGAEFTDKHGRLNKWPGFITKGESLLANFIYCQKLRDNDSYTTVAGEASMKSVNAERVSAANKLVRAWNEAVEWVYLLDDYLIQNSAKYPLYTGLINGYCLGNKRYFTKLTTFGA